MCEVLQDAQLSSRAADGQASAIPNATRDAPQTRSGCSLRQPKSSTRCLCAGLLQQEQDIATQLAGAALLSARLLTAAPFTSSARFEPAAALRTMPSHASSGRARDYAGCVTPAVE